MNKIMMIILLAASITPLMGVHQYKLQQTIRPPFYVHGMRQKEATSIAELKNGNIAFASHWNTWIKIWDATPGGQLIRTLQTDTRTEKLTALDDDTIASLNGGTIKILDLVYGEVLETLRNNDLVYGLTKLEDGRLVAGLRNGDINIWNPFSGELDQVLHNNGSVFAVTTLEDGRLVIGLINNSYINIWNPYVGELEGTIDTNNLNDSLTTLKNGEIVTGRADGMINIWDPSSGKRIQSLQGDSPAMSLITLKDGRFAALLDSGEIKIYG